MNVTLEAFREQMAWLAENKKVIPLAEAAAGGEGVAITFDDGFRDNLVNAAPELAKHKFPATVFVVAGRLGGTLDAERDPERGVLLTEDEARELESMSISIGGHTVSHARLSSLTSGEQEREIVGCLERLAEVLGHAIESFAYPYGSSLDYDADSARLVRAAGCGLAVSNRYGVNPQGSDRWTLRRIWIDRSDSIESFVAKVLGDLDALCILDSWAGIRARRIINAVVRA
jgi:peptidoglycan/xylan/chitin deacetylase (PgdA/CDA1 family)